MSAFVRTIPSVLAVALLAGSLACQSAQDKAFEAQEKSYSADAKIKQKRLELVEEYEKCTEKNPGHEEDACGHLLRAIEATK